MVAAGRGGLEGHNSTDGVVRGLEWALGQAVDYCGGLKKKQARIGGFVKRYFELRGSALVYYARRGSPARGFIDLTGARVRESREFMARPRGYTDCAIFIDAAPRALTLFPKTPADASTWLAFISKAISRAQACPRCLFRIPLQP